MKRIFLSLFFTALFGTSFLSAQVIFQEDFDNGMPANFTLLNVDNLTPAANVAYVTSAWIVREDFVNLPEDSIAVSTSWYTPSGISDDWMITPQISLTTNNILSWEASALDVNFPDGYQVLISTTTPTTAAFTSLLTIPAENTTWTSRSIDLQASGYSNQNVYIAFRNNSNDQFLLFIDDILVAERNTVCGQDTVDYALAKATAIPRININNATSATSIAMYFDAPQALEISGFSFLANKSDTAGGTAINVTCELYIAGADSMPTGAALATDRVTVDTNQFGGNIAQLEKHAHWAAVNLSVPYCVVISNPTANPVDIYNSDYTATPADGLQEWLSSVDLFGTWTRSYAVNVGGIPFDADPIVAPHVKYTIDADFTPLVGTGAIGIAENWTDNSSPILSNRMYNAAAAFGNAADSWNWNYGDLSPIDNVINGNHTYAANGSYSVTLTDSMFGWRMLCADSQTGSMTIGSPPAACVGSCGPDTADYPLAKTTGFQQISINNATSALGICQYFNTPQPITVSGMTFPCFSTFGGTQTVTCELYLAGSDSTPTGSPLASGTVAVDTNFYGGTLSLLEKHVSWTPVTMTQPYVVVMTNNTANNVAIFTNDYTATPADGLGEFLASANLFGTWTRGYALNVGGVPFDADWIVAPHVCFDLTADFTPNSTSGVAGNAVNWTNNSSAVLGDRMYNIAAFLGTPEQSYSWNYGTGPGLDNVINGSNTYVAAGNYTVTLTDSLFGWRTTCTHDTTGTVSIVSGGPCPVDANTVGSASNIFTQILTESNQVIANNDLNSILFIHRNNTASFGGHSGQIRYDLSTNGGLSWTSDVGVLNPLSVNGTNAARYPQISFYNPTSNTNPNNAYLVYKAATTAATWNGTVSGVRRLNGTGNTENYNQATGTNTLIPRSQVEGAPGTYWSIDAVFNGTIISGFRVLKGNWNGTNDVVWSVNNTITPSFNTTFNGDPQVADFAIGFDPTGQEGWICALTHLTSSPTDSAFYPVFYHTVDAGTTWTGPTTVDLGSFSCISSNIGAGNVATAAFDLDLTVDVNGDPHALLEVGNAPGLYSIFPAQWRAMYDITQSNGIWTALEIAPRQAFRGTFGITPNSVDQDAHPQAARTQDGTKLFFTWTDSDTNFTAGTDNTAPNLIGRSYNVTTGQWDAVTNHTSCDPTVSGRALFPKLSPIVLGNSGSYTIPAVVAALNVSGNPIDPTTSLYLDSISVADADFVNNQCVSTVTISGPSSFCPGSSITLDAGAGYDEYLWSNGATTQTISVNAVGTYTCAARTGCCLAGTASVTITQDPLPASSWTSSSNLLVASFSDASTNSTSWFWDFGDGNNSTAQNPTHTYATAGTYTVCQTVSGLCGSDSTCSTVTVTSCVAPVAAFSNTSGSLSVSFTDATTNTPTGWLYDFGDGNTSTSQNPTHVYAAPGNYTVCLTTTNACGSDSSCTPITVTCAAPTAAFTNTTGALSVDFTDGSTSNGGGATGWSWTFGDGNTSTAQNPTHVYAAPGTYTVCLTTTDPCGSNTVCNSVTVTCAAPTSAFTNTSGSLTVNFTDASTSNGAGITAWAWTFGDGNISSAQNPQHTYASSGSYTVCLTTTDVCGTNTVCNPITVSCTAPVAGFTSNVTQLTADFTDASTSSSGGATAWAWTFGDGNTASTQNPQHVYAAPGTYTVCLTVTDACDTNTTCQSVTVTCSAPVAGFTNSATELVVDFTDASTSVGGGVTAWAWDFGDGNASTQQNPQHTYAAAGTYTVCLTVTDVCDTNTSCQTITVTCAAPVSSFSFSNSGLTVIFTDLSTGTPTGWDWDFGDGNFSTQQSPTHTYAADGNYTVCLVATNACDTNSSCQSLQATGWEELSGLSGLDLYPNPTSSTFTLEGRFNQAMDVEISMVNLLGVRVMEIESGRVNGTFKREVDLSRLAAGVYYLRFESEGHSVMRKVVKQ